MLEIVPSPFVVEPASGFNTDLLKKWQPQRRVWIFLSTPSLPQGWAAPGIFLFVPKPETYS